MSDAFFTWKQTDPEDYPGRLWAEPQPTIEGLPCHLIALRVTHADPGGNQVAHDPAFEGELEAAMEIAGAGPFRTTEIEGFEGEYVVLLYPHCE